MKLPVSPTSTVGLHLGATAPEQPGAALQLGDAAVAHHRQFHPAMVIFSSVPQLNDSKFQYRY